MPADLEPRFFVDETSLGIARALALVRGDVLHPGHRRLPEIPTGTPDPIWMPLIAERNLVVISRDKHIKSKPAELAAFRTYGLRAFWISGPKDLGNWETLVRIVHWWNEMERLIRDRREGPWFYALNATGVAEIVVVDRVKPARSAPPQKAPSVDTNGQLRLDLPR